MFGINFLRSFRKRSETFKSCKETFLNLMAFRWLSTLLSTSFQMWRQFINTFHFGAWNRNFSTRGSILTTPFWTTQEVAILSLWLWCMRGTWLPHYIAVWKVQIKYGGHSHLKVGHQTITMGKVKLLGLQAK